MSFDQPFADPIISTKRQGTQNDPFLSTEEMISVINGKALLAEVPNKFDRVQIIEKVGVGSVQFYEIESGSPTTENQYVVDYVQGILTFHESQNGSNFTCKYYGTGFHYFPSSRIWTKDNGNGTVETLDDILTEGTEKITEITESITEANQAIINANNASMDMQTVLSQQTLIYKASVNTFADLSSTYPYPQLGWTVVVKDTGIRYRYDSTSWVDIGFSTESDGFTVVVGSTPPLNKNLLWVDAPGENRTATIVQSDTPPSNTSVIWWKTN